MGRRGWMLRVFSAGSLIAGLLGTMGATGATAAGVPGYLVRDVQASRYTARTDNDCPRGQTTLTCFQFDTETEPSLAVNPTNPLNVVVVMQQGRRDDGGAAANGYATTLDGGKTWTSGQLPGVTTLTGGPFDRASDPVVAFGPDGTVYAQSLVFNFTGQRRGLWNNVSHDGGITWELAEESITTDDTYGGTDKNWLSVDLDDTLGHHPGRIYVAWDRPVGPVGIPAPVTVAYSDDKGATWSIQDIGWPAYLGQGIGTLPLVLKDGSLAVLWNTFASPVPPSFQNPADHQSDANGTLSKFLIARSPGAGLVPTGGPLIFTPPVTVATYRGEGIIGQRAGDSIPAAIVDPVSGSIYVVWNDARYRDDDRNDIVLARSDDNGLTWTKPIPVNPGPRDNYVQHYLPMIGIGPDGDVRVAYRRRQENDFNHGKFFSQRVDTVYQVSTDKGATFSAPLKVNTVTSHMGYATRSRGGAFLGDYHQLGVAGDLTYIVHTEPVRVSPGEAFAFPPAFHHQRTWVAVVSSNPADVAKPTEVLGEKQTKPKPDLPRTGVGFTPMALALLGSMGLVASWVKRGR